MIDGFYQQAAGDALLQSAQDVQCSNKNKLQEESKAFSRTYKDAGIDREAVLGINKKR